MFFLAPLFSTAAATATAEAIAAFTTGATTAVSVFSRRR